VRKLIHIAVFLCIIPSISFADSVFKLDLFTDISLGSGSIGLFTASRLISPNPEAAGKFDSINALDRSFVFNYNKPLDTLGTIAAYGLLIAPVTSVLYEIDFPEKFITYGIMYAEAFLLTYGTKDLLKSLISRHRPYTYLEPVPAGEEEEYFLGFPSGHSSLAFLGATFLSYTFSLEYPGSGWTLPIVITSYSLATFVGVTRVISGNHFITDVIAGSVIGSLWGWFVPFLHRESENDFIVINPQPGGLSFSVKF